MGASEFASAYVNFVNAERGSVEYSANFWAFDRISALCISEPFEAWAAVKEVLAHDHSPNVTSSLGAGPIEELLVNHGRKLIDLIERDAIESASIRDALRSVWRSDTDPGVWRRVEKLGKG